MIRSAIISMACVLGLCGEIFAADDPIGAKLTSAKEEHEKALDKAHDDLVEALKQKVKSAKASGNLDLVEKVEVELKAFENMGTLPKLVSPSDYTSALRTARARLKTAYETAVKEYTIADKKELAKAARGDLEELNKEETSAKPAAGITDGLPAGTKLRGTALTRSGPPTNKAVGREHGMTITTRSGKNFTGTFGPFEIEGTIKSGAVTFTFTKFPGQATHPAIGNNTFFGRFDKAKGTLTGKVLKRDDKTFASLINFKVEKD